MECGGWCEDTSEFISRTLAELGLKFHFHKAFESQCEASFQARLLFLCQESSWLEFFSVSWRMERRLDANSGNLRFSVALRRGEGRQCSLMVSH